MKHLTLRDGSALPAVGLGCWKLDNATAADRVYEAIRLGYRHIDAASDYGNEVEIGEGIRRALEAGHCRREDLWVTSKLWNTYHDPQHVHPALERSLSDLQLDYLDLYHIHFPIPLRFVPFQTRYPPEWFFDPTAETPRMEPVDIPMSKTWTAMEELKDRGWVRHIGLCNVGCMLLREICSGARHQPEVLQVELHPYLCQEKLLRLCRELNIAVTGFSPLGALSYVPLGMAEAGDNVLKEPVVQQIATAHHITPAQALLAWGIQRGTSVVPKTNRVDRLAENLAVLDIELSADEVTRISTLDRGRRFNDPAVFCETTFNCFYPIFE